VQSTDAKKTKLTKVAKNKDHPEKNIDIVVSKKKISKPKSNEKYK